MTLAERLNKRISDEQERLLATPTGDEAHAARLAARHGDLDDFRAWIEEETECWCDGEPHDELCLRRQWGDK